MHKRQVWSTIQQEITTDEVVVITGPRQVGKTTTLKWLLQQIKGKNKIYFDLENLADRELFETKDYDSLLNEFQNRGLDLDQKIYIALDEIQLLPNLPSIVKYLYDHYQIKFFLSGSSSYYIKHRFTESMAGRKVIYEMFPLTFSEFLDFQGVDYTLDSRLSIDKDFSDTLFQKLDTYYQEYIEYGGLPKVVLADSVRRKRSLLEEIFSSYINIDVQTLADFKSTKDLRNLIKLLASRVGSRLNVSELASILGITRVTVESYLEFLEQTYLIRSISVYSKSLDIKTRMQRKVYFIDTGIANVNGDLSGGAKFENTVCHQLQFYGDLSYFANRDGEIDFILDKDGEKFAFEVKETPTRTDQDILERRAQKLDIANTRVIGEQPPARFKSFLWGGGVG